jgi:hypothetical protein
MHGRHTDTSEPEVNLHCCWVLAPWNMASCVALTNKHMPECMACITSSSTRGSCSKPPPCHRGRTSTPLPGEQLHHPEAASSLCKKLKIATTLVLAKQIHRPAVSSSTQDPLTSLRPITGCAASFCRHFQTRNHFCTTLRAPQP